MGMSAPNHRLFTYIFIGTAFIGSARAQLALTGAGPGTAVRIFHTDMAVLEAGESRKDLPCTVVSTKPVLGFDLKYHSGYEVSVPLKELAGSENALSILFRVTPLDSAEKGQAAYFMQRFRVPAIQEEASGEAYLTGVFDLGEGKYKVDWLMRDRTERVCASAWEIEAILPPRDKQIALGVGPGVVRPSDAEQFQDDPPVMRAQELPLNVKVLINFAPQNSRSATLQPLDTSALVSILRTISRDPRIGKFSIVAFNLHEQKVIFRQDDADRIDFPNMGKALENINLGTVDLKRLAEKNGETEFLSDLIRREVSGTGEPDAIVFAGPKAMLEENVSQDTLREVGELRSPVFYMNYNLHPQSVPWNDAIGRAVKFLKGYEYTISKPRDLWFAVTEMVSRIAKLKSGRPSVATSAE